MYTTFLNSFPNMYIGMAVALAMLIGGLLIVYFGGRVQGMGKILPLSIGTALVGMGSGLFLVGVIHLTAGF